MIEIAWNKKIYDELHAVDIMTFLDRTTDRYNLFLATDVFIYMGKLERLFQLVGKRCLTGACFAFSVEDSGDENFKLQPTARYAHSTVYIENLSRRCGFQILLRESLTLWKEKEEPIRGTIFILRLPPESGYANAENSTLRKEPNSRSSE